MKNFFSNTGYFIKETFVMIRLNLWSNILSVLSTGLIFFVLAMVVSGWWVSAQVVETIRAGAEINIYFDKTMNRENILLLVEKIKNLEGVRDSRVVDEKEAYERMVKILGKEAEVLSVFDNNPFSSFIEVRIDLKETDHIIKDLNHIKGIEYIRDNKDVLDRLGHITDMLMFLGSFVVAAVAISTLVIISHIIRLGIYNSREQINTLRLLGAPEIFIACPFFLEGVLLTLAGSLVAAALADFAIKQVYAQMSGPLPFIPLPPREALTAGMKLTVVSFGGILGIIGSLLGFSSAKSKNQ